MNTLDTTLLIIAAFFTVLGLYWGIIRQVLAVVGLLVGTTMAGRYGGEVANWLSSFVSNTMLARALGFILVLMLVSALASLAASVIRIFLGLLFLGWLDHLLGGLLGLIQAILAGALVTMIIVTFPMPTWQAALDGSQFAPFLLRVGGLVALLLPELFRVAIQLALGN